MAIQQARYNERCKSHKITILSNGFLQSTAWFISAKNEVKKNSEHMLSDA